MPLSKILLTAAVLGGLFVPALIARAGTAVQLGPRPFFLVEDMDAGKLKTTLQRCANGPFRKTDFSIGHRGAALQFPEHTKESYEAAARMGAGILECDVTFTKDRELVCRHSQCDLHTTTNILAIPELAAKCTKPFSPAVIDPATGAVDTGLGRVLRQRHHAGRIQDAVRQDGCGQSQGEDRRGISERHPELAHGFVLRLRHGAQPPGEHRTLQAPGREDDARTQIPQRADAV